jgi:hypothetical protein
MLKIESLNIGLEDYTTFIYGLNSNSIELLPSPYDEEEITFLPGIVQIHHKSLKLKSSNTGLEDHSTLIEDDLDRSNSNMIKNLVESILDDDNNNDDDYNGDDEYEDDDEDDDDDDDDMMIMMHDSWMIYSSTTRAE